MTEAPAHPSPVFAARYLRMLADAGWRVALHALPYAVAAGVITEGFLRLRMPPWARRLVTRGIAIVPVVIVTALYGENGTAKLLVLSQVVLSMQLPFAVVPLIRFVSDRRGMGELVISGKTVWLAWAIAAVIIALNAKLLFDTFTSI